MTNDNVLNDELLVQSNIWHSTVVVIIGRNRRTMEFFFLRINISNFPLLLRHFDFAQRIYSRRSTLSLGTRNCPFFRRVECVIHVTKMRSFYTYLWKEMRGKKTQKFEALKFFTLTKHLSSESYQLLLNTSIEYRFD